MSLTEISESLITELKLNKRQITFQTLHYENIPKKQHKIHLNPIHKSQLHATHKKILSYCISFVNNTISVYKRINQRKTAVKKILISATGKTNKKQPLITKRKINKNKTQYLSLNLQGKLLRPFYLSLITAIT